MKYIGQGSIALLIIGIGTAIVIFLKDRSNRKYEEWRDKW